ncbi:hypothetical protein ETB97_007519 [Aspergillus alliaceus]|uniref:Cystinosin n=1 Tax=Petromyces alliaceus TaxID=209559 RepID=A0A8H6E2Y7_PETAA|nr:hypothetical protein ETB97_007519 [Aspergillus burnettii]
MSSQVEMFIKALSRLLGWIYTICWSASFYPQPITNFQRSSTFGLAIDFPTINVLGYICYTGSEESTVRFNDFVFAVHAVILSIITYTQFWPIVYSLSYVKLLVTITKYVPQAWVNYKRKSTQGWHIGQILLDLAGGMLSLIQLFIDSSFQDDWSGITGNPVKLLLSNVSILFDFLFMVQHYILYRDADDHVDKYPGPDVTTPLLSESNGVPRAEDA